MISVILCTHNPRPDYLTETLKGLRAQSLPLLEWELLIIDNASIRGSEPSPDLSWHPKARLLREDKLGLTPARLRGIREAEGELYVFVDDDNVLDPDYLDAALRIAEIHPFLGAWSGQCIPAFEEPPPEWSRRYWGNLAVREFKEDLWSNLPRLAETMPCGAGLCVRQEVAQYYLDLHNRGDREYQLDRTGDSLVSGGDNDLAACACYLKLGVGLISSLKLRHLIPPDRLTVEYMTRLAEGIAFSSVLLDAKCGLSPKRPSVGRRICDQIRLFGLNRIDRSIQRGVTRGRERAFRICNRGKVI